MLFWKGDNIMAETLSHMVPLGSLAPSFELPDTRTGKILSLDHLKSNIATVIMFICNHCPYVKLILPKLLDVARHYQTQGIHFIAISANDVTNYPDDSPEKMKALAVQQNFPFPYLYDETQAIAHAYHAACTPDFYVFDAHLSCIYRGRFDEATPGNGKLVTGHDLCRALDSILAKRSIAHDQKPSMGCNIKWKEN